MLENIKISHAKATWIEGVKSMATKEIIEEGGKPTKELVNDRCLRNLSVCIMNKTSAKTIFKGLPRVTEPIRNWIEDNLPELIEALTTGYILDSYMLYIFDKKLFDNNASKEVVIPLLGRDEIGSLKYYYLTPTETPGVLIDKSTNVTYNIATSEDTHSLSFNYEEVLNLRTGMYLEALTRYQIEDYVADKIKEFNGED